MPAPVIMLKRHAAEVTGGLTQTSKMPCKSYSLPTLACKTGFKLAQIPGTVCADCYADKGFYAMYKATIEPAQMARLASLDDPLWVDAMVALIGADSHFRWHDSGDLQSEEHFGMIVAVALRTPGTMHWLPTREPETIARYLRTGGSIPPNLIIRVSATYPDRPVALMPELRGHPNILMSNVHTPGQQPLGMRCNAPDQNGECRDCRACWSPAVPAVSYEKH